MNLRILTVIQYFKFLLFWLLLLTLSTSCTGTQDVVFSTAVSGTGEKLPLGETQPKPTETIIVTPDVFDEGVVSDSIYFEVPFPDQLLAPFVGIPVNDTKAEDTLVFGLVSSETPQPNQLWQADWVFAAVVSFPQITESISSLEIIELWKNGKQSQAAYISLYVSAQTFDLFSALWGPHSSSVHVVGVEELTDALWNDPIGIALVPFEQIEPQQKVLAVDGQNPLEKGKNLSDYPLTISLAAYFTDDGLRLGADIVEAISLLPTTNRDEAKMTTVLLTGVTALVRETAQRMLVNDILYPIQDISGWLITPDITHMSNEVSFYSACPISETSWSGSRFCAPLDFFALIQEADIDVIELTGNHVMDYGDEAFGETLVLYKAAGIEYYGGGVDLPAARKPLIIEDHGNSIAFLGCNVPGPERAFATEYSPGAASCDLEWMGAEIDRLKRAGKLVIVTFQHYETCQPTPMSGQRVDFTNTALAGADIVSGSQAHCAQGMDFQDDSFIHYGLGNLFFDQMWRNYRPQFLDLHTFYEGRYINTQLLTAMLEDSAKPRPMTLSERESFLQSMFAVSGWVDE